MSPEGHSLIHSFTHSFTGHLPPSVCPGGSMVGGGCQACCSVPRGERGQTVGRERPSLDVCGLGPGPCSRSVCRECRRSVELASHLGTEWQRWSEVRALARRCGFGASIRVCFLRSFPVASPCALSSEGARGPSRGRGAWQGLGGDGRQVAGFAKNRSL